MRAHCTSPTGASVSLHETPRRFVFRELDSIPSGRWRALRLLDPRASLLIEEPRLTLESRLRAMERAGARRLRRIDLDRDRAVFRGVVIDPGFTDEVADAWVPHEVAISGWGRLVARRETAIVWSGGDRRSPVVSRSGVLDVRATLSLRRSMGFGEPFTHGPVLGIGRRSETCMDGAFGSLTEFGLPREMSECDSLLVGACLSARSPGILRPRAPMTEPASRRARRRSRVAAFAICGWGIGHMLMSCADLERERTRLERDREDLRAQVERAVLERARADGSP